MLEQITALMIAAKNDFEIRRAEALYDLYVQEQERTAPKPKGLTINELLNKVSDGIVNALPVLMPLLQQLSAISQMQQSEQGCSDCDQSLQYAQCLEVAKTEEFEEWFKNNTLNHELTEKNKQELYELMFSPNSKQALINDVITYLSCYDDENVEQSTPDEETHFEVPLPPVVSDAGDVLMYSKKRRKTENTTV